MSVWLIFGIAFFAVCAAQTRYTSVINTASGPVRGQILTTVRSSGDYASFTGIPFGEPPVGYLRFKPPVERKNWTEVLNATNQADVCVQPLSLSARTTMGSEDCLYLNVYTPHTNFTKPKVLKPVMFWIYGGGFIVGSQLSSLFRPDFLLEDDVIVVSANYRLGPLGFLNLYHRNATGNAGLKDQTLALKWVKKNIENFGGDPNRVTIFGQSAGAVSVDYHVLSDLSKGLFNQAISMSGSPLNLYWGLQTSEEAELEAFTLGSKLGVRIKNKDVLLSALYSTSADKIIAKASELSPLAFRVTVEKRFDQEQTFLARCSLRKYVTGDYNRVPYMTGFTSNEAKAFIGNPNASLAGILGYGLRSLKYGGVPLEIPIFQAFIDTVSNSSLSAQTYEKIIETATDLFFVTGIDSKQRFMSLLNGFPIYYYRFSFEASSYLNSTKNQTVKGVGHAEDLAYLFYIPGTLPIKQPEIAIMITRYTRLMTNFAKYGNPTPLGKADPLLLISWPNSGMVGRHLEISRVLRIGLRPIDTRVKVYQLAGAGNSPLLNECIDKSCLTL